MLAFRGIVVQTGSTVPVVADPQHRHDALGPKERIEAVRLLRGDLFDVEDHAAAALERRPSISGPSAIILASGCPHQVIVEASCAVTGVRQS